MDSDQFLHRQGFLMYNFQICSKRKSLTLTLSSSHFPHDAWPLCIQVPQPETVILKRQLRHGTNTLFSQQILSHINHPLKAGDQRSTIKSLSSKNKIYVL